MLVNMGDLPHPDNDVLRENIWSVQKASDSSKTKLPSAGPVPKELNQKNKIVTSKKQSKGGQGSATTQQYYQMLQSGGPDQAPERSYPTTNMNPNGGMNSQSGNFPIANVQGMNGMIHDEKIKIKYENDVIPNYD
jgi:hypothetical protein